jgi:hypothetical protein
MQELAKLFKVKSIKKTQGPSGSQEGDWYTYVLENGNSTINGVRRGSLQQVTTHAENFAEELNTRNRSASHSIWAPRKKKQ